MEVRIDKIDKTYFLAIATISKDSLTQEDIVTYSKASIDRDPLEQQVDLMKIISILASTGMNRNDDVFLPEEILPIRNTGAHKPINKEHDPKQIVGHMLRTYAALKDGSIISSDEKPETNEFDIVAESVLYQYLFPDYADEVRRLAKAKQLFVSIEAWFTAYDFLVGSKIVKRNAETSSILDKILRINGGEGVYEGKKVGRVLRNMVIGGMGLVRKPANPGSIIKSVASLESEIVSSNIEDVIVNNNIIGDILMLSTSSLKENQMDKDEVLEEVAQVIAAQRVAAEVNITEEVKTEVSPDIKALLDRVAALEVGNRELKVKLEASEHKSELDRRNEALKKIGLSEEFIVANLSDKFFAKREDFDSFVNILVAALAELNKKAKEKDNKETATEGGEQVKATAEVITPTTIKSDTKVEEKQKEEVVEVKTETVAPEAASDKKEEESVKEDETEDVISLEDLDLVDKEVKVETDSKAAPSIADRMGHIVQQFLKNGNDKWEKLALNK